MRDREMFVSCVCIIVCVCGTCVSQICVLGMINDGALPCTVVINAMLPRLLESPRAREKERKKIRNFDLLLRNGSSGLTFVRSPLQCFASKIILSASPLRPAWVGRNGAAPKLDRANGN